MDGKQSPRWASVKFEEKYGSKCLNLPITHIMCPYVSKKGKDKKKPFEPIDVQDFEPHQWYLAFVGEKDEFDEDRKSYPAYNVLIGRLAVTLDELNSEGRKRIHWSSIAEKGQDPETSGETETSGTEVGGVSQQKAARQEKKKRRREGAQHEMDDYIQAHQLEVDAEDTVESLREKIRKLEEQQQQQQLASTSFSSVSSSGQSELSVFFQNLKEELKELKNVQMQVQHQLNQVVQKVDTVQDTVLQKVQELNQKVATIDDNISKSPPTKRRYVQNWIDQISRD